MTFLQMSDSENEDEVDGRSYRAQMQRKRSHVTEGSQKNRIDNQRLRNKRVLERQLLRETNEKFALTQTIAKWSSTSEDSAETDSAVSLPYKSPSPEEEEWSSTSEDSAGFETDAAVSFVTPAAMQRPPNKEELDNCGHIGKFVVYLTAPGRNQPSSDYIPLIVLGWIKGI